MPVAKFDIIRLRSEFAGVCEHFAWLHGHPIAAKREQDCTLAIAVLKLAPLRDWQKRGHVLLLLNDLGDYT